MRFSASIVLALLSATTIVSAVQLEDSDYSLQARDAEPEPEDFSIYAREAFAMQHARDLALNEHVVAPLRRRGWEYGECMSSGACRLPHGMCMPSPPNPCKNPKNKGKDCQCKMK
ncbi:hypothetical protein MMC26_007639 [Xylographa opegraphella]|nr:hypothetical protein [Xylographa opegraphella]